METPKHIIDIRIRAAQSEERLTGSHVAKELRRIAAKLQKGTKLTELEKGMLNHYNLKSHETH